MLHVSVGAEGDGDAGASRLVAATLANTSEHIGGEVGPVRSLHNRSSHPR